MVNIEIVEGLKEAMARGESLKQAMFSFYNAGYGKQEIEDAARYVLQILQNEQQRIITQQQAQAALQKPLKQVEQQSKQVTVTQPFQKIQTQPLQQPIAVKPPQQIEHQTQPSQQFIQKTQTQLIPQPKQKIINPQLAKIVQPQIQRQIPQQQSQKVSDYNHQTKSSKSLTIILLIFILIVLFGALVSLFLFKDQVIEFFNNLF